jgi:5-methylcytosine-specific restriction endonuclease McrBC regulatory subunit McrC
VRSSDGEFGYYEILPDIIIWDELEGRAHLIIDTKWKKHDGSMSDARQADAYQVHAYSTTYSKRYKTASGLAKTYYPPVCLLYPVIGQAGAPLVGEFTGTGSEFLLASAPMDQEHFEFDPAVVLGDCWPK